MSIFKKIGNLFKKKPGGTLVGNILRGVTGAATGGILGSGKNMIPAQPELEQEVLQSINSLTSSPSQYLPQPQKPLIDLKALFGLSDGIDVNVDAGNSVKKWTPIILLGLLAVIFLPKLISNNNKR